MGANLSKALGAFLPFSLGHIPVESHLGFVMAALSGRLFGSKEMRLLMLGLDAAGKTSKEPLLRPSFSPSSYFLDDAHGNPTAILYKLKLNQSVTTIPTGALSYNSPHITRRFTFSNHHSRFQRGDRHV